MINFLKDKNKLRDVATLTTATLATLSLAATNPAVAALFKIGFCGNFDDGSGSVLPSYVIVESNQTGDKNAKYGLKDAKIGTSRGIPPTVVSYNYSNLLGDGSQEIYQGTDVVRWTFDSLGNIFDVRVPVSVLNDLASLPIFSNDFNTEQRVGGVLGKDIDDFIVTPVPEPTSILGTAIAIGLGGMLTKKNLSKLKDDKEAA
ncbi:MAG: PEP-CTERM sorting domain-containing protein [Microcystis aeruginosa G13-11]|jgi:hypothetical protein|nr:PEP-CTERM sorting domain-containing protein [Microcystis aeruginosa G13-11]